MINLTRRIRIVLIGKGGIGEVGVGGLQTRPRISRSFIGEGVAVGENIVAGVGYWYGGVRGAVRQGGSGEEWSRR